MSAISLFAPAKLNLFLAVTGRRADGFHDLVSLVAPLDFGDVLWAEPAGTFSLECDNAAVPVDDSNLVLKAAQAFAGATSWEGGARFFLEKRIPMGAGLGGGSSDAVAALRALDRLAGNPLEPAALAEVAAKVGSDCPLFLYDSPVVIRGRGERVERLPPETASRLRGRRVLIFKPEFGIATPWAYAELANEAPAGYLPANEAEARLAQWRRDQAAPLPSLLFNNLERPAFAKFAALPVLLEQLRGQFGLKPLMSGSGSACFALLPEDATVPAMVEAVRAAWGSSAFVIEARVA